MKKIAFLLIFPIALLLGVQTVTAQQKSTSLAETNWDNFRPETLSGTISMVEPGTKALFVTGPGEVSYKFLVTNKTKIEVDGTTSAPNELASQTQKQATITFVARPNGNFAQDISIGG